MPTQMELMPGALRCLREKLFLSLSGYPCEVTYSKSKPYDRQVSFPPSTASSIQLFLVVPCSHRGSSEHKKQRKLKTLVRFRLECSRHHKICSTKKCVSLSVPLFASSNLPSSYHASPFCCILNLFGIRGAEHHKRATLTAQPNFLPRHSVTVYIV